MMHKSFHKLFKAAFVFICLFLNSMAMASFERSTAVGAEEKTENRYINLFSYSLSSDAVDSNKQKVINQGLRYNGTYFFMNNKLYSSFGLGTSFHSVDNQLIEDDNGVFRLTDLYMSFGSSGFQLYDHHFHKVSFFGSLSNVVPLSETSRNEGYKSVPSFRGDFVYQRGRFNFVLTGQYAYVVNSFETNSLGTPNLNSSLIGGLALRMNFKHFRAQYSYRIGVNNYWDGSNVGTSGNNLSLTGIINNSLWVSLATSNVNYVEDQFIDLWFYDPFARIYSLSMGVTF